jgi:hypothetical protein
MKVEALRNYRSSETVYMETGSVLEAGHFVPKCMQ